MAIGSFLWSRSSSFSSRRQSRRHSRRILLRGAPCCNVGPAPLTLELLENRWLLTVLTWDGGGDGVNWNDANNWNRSGDNANVLPASADDVTIDSAADPTVSIRTPVTIHSLITNEAISVIAGGTLSVATADVNATLTLNGGTVQGGLYDLAGGQLTAGSNSNSRLSSVSIGSGDIVLPAGSRLRVTGGLSLSDGVAVRLTGSEAYLGFEGTQTLASGLVSFENPTGTSHVTVEGNATLTLGPGVTVQGGRGDLANTQFAIGGTYSLVNQGTIEADSAGTTITVGSTGSFTNSGTLRATGGGLLNVTRVAGNLNAASVEGAGSQLTLAGTGYVNNLGLAAPAGTILTLNGAWSSTGGINVSGGTLNLGGTFTTAGLNLGGFTRAGGTVNLTGTLNNAGDTLPLGAITGSWNLEGGTLAGGTLEQTVGSALLIGANAANAISALTVASGDIVAPANARLRILNGLTMAAGSALRLTGSNSDVGFLGSQTFSGDVRFESPNGISNVTVEGNSTLTLAPGSTVSGGRGTIANTQFIAGGTYALVNQGTIEANVAGQTLTVGSTTSFTNSGSLRASAGGLLSVTDLTGDLNTAIVNGTGSQLALAGTNYVNNLGLAAPAGTTLTLNGSWSSPGGISVNAGTLNLGGSFTTAGLNLPAFTRSGGTVNLTGTLNNAAATLTLNAATGSWNLEGGTLSGGTLEQSGASLVIGANSNNTLSGLTVGSGDIVVPANARLRSTNGLTMAAGSTLRLTGNASFAGFVGSQTFSGAIRFESATGTSFVTVEGNSTLTLGPGSTVTGGRGGIANTQIFVGGTYSLVNQGTIESNVAGAQITVSPTGSFTNSGTLRVTGGSQLNVNALTGNLNTASIEGGNSQLSLAGTNYVNNLGLDVSAGTTVTLNGSWSSPGGIAVNGGTLNLGGTFTTAGLNLPAFTRSGGVVNLTGTLNNIANTLTLNSGTGTWNLDGGTLSGGTLEQAGASLLISGNGSNTLSGVTVASGDIVAPANARLRVTNGLTMAAGSTVRLTGNSGFVGFVGSQTFSGAILFESPTGTSFVTVEGNSTLTLGPGATVSGGRGGIASTQIFVGGTYSLVNQGTIEANVSGAPLTVGSTGSFTNSGTLRASSGGQVNVTNIAGNLNAAFVSGAGSQLTLNGTNYVNNAGLAAPAGTTLTLDGSWSSPGGIAINGGTLNLGGSFTTTGLNLPGLTRTGGTINLTGTLNNAGNTLTLNAATGSWNLAGGTLSGGTLEQSDASLLIGSNGANTFSGVTVNSGDIIAPANARLRVLNSLTLAPGVALRLTGGNSGVGFFGSQTLTSGLISFENASGTSFVTIEGAGTLTLGPGVTVSGGRGAIASTQFFVGGTYSLANQGTISANVSGTALNVGSTGAFTNTGTLQATGGGQLTLPTFTNNGGTLSAGASSTITISGNYAQSSGSTLLQGGILDPTGTFDLQGGALSGFGTIRANVTSAGQVSPGGAGAAGNLRVEGTYVQSATGILDVEVGGATAGTLHDRLEVTGAATLGGTLNVSVINGYQAPTTGIIYGVLPYASRTGSFASITGLSQPNGRGFAVDYSTTRFALISDVSDNAGPVVVSSQPTGLVNANVASLRLQFNEPVDASSFTSSDVVLTTPAGAVSTTLIAVVQVDATTFDVQFPVQSQDGNYSVAIGPNVTDLAGNPMSATYTATFTLDQTGPRVLSITPNGDINPPLSTMEVTFDSEIDPATFQVADVVLSRPSTPISPSSITRLSPTTFRLTFPAQSAPGDYTVRIGPDIRDLAGNLMDQDGDGARGEPVQDVFTSTATVRAVDLQVTALSVSAAPVLQSGATLTITWTDTNSGNGATGGSWNDRVRVVNTTTGTTLLDTTVFYDAASQGAIPAGQSRSRLHSFRLPDGPAGAGDLQVTVTADSSGAILETNAGGTAETNNSASANVTSTLAPYPDLRVSALTVNPSDLMAGQVMTVRWNDENAGDGPTGVSWSDRVFIRNVTTGQTLLNTTLFYDRSIAANGDIQPGTFHSREYQFRLPDGTPGVGQLQVDVTADTNNNVVEFNAAGTAETNNTATALAASSLAPYPDLVAEAIAFTPASPKSGDSVTVKWTERNTGNAAVASSSYTRVRITRAGDSSVVTDQVLFFSATVNSSLTAGGTANRQLAFNLPNGPSGSGTFNVQITTDNYNQIFEHNAGGTAETNNVTTSSFLSTLNSYPDLTVTGLAVTPASPRAGQSLTINYALTNAGDGPVAQAFHYSVQVTHVATGQSLYSRVEQYDAAALGAIAPAASKPRSATFTLPDGALGAGDLQITVRADYFNSIFEYNAAGTAETNNQAQTTVTSALGQYPDLRVADVTVTSGTVKPGDQVLVSWSLINGGTAAVSGPFSERVYLSADSAPGGDDLLKTITFDGTLEAGQSIARNAIITVPAFGAGQRWLVVQADTANQVFEENEANNVATSATSLNIPLGLAITATSTQLTEGGPVTNVTVSRNGPSSTSLVVNLANTQPGSLMVPAIVTIPAGSATVTFAVTPTNNTQVDGTRNAVVSATAGGFAGSSLEVTITDDDIPTLTVQLSPNPVSEGEGNGSLHVRVFRNIATTSALTVHLTSDDVLRATVPATAVIPAGAAFVDVLGDILDNIYIDGLRSIGITASASGFTPGTDRTLFLDNDIPTLTLSAEQTTLSEAAGTYGTTATISRAVASPIDLYVQLTGGNGNLILPTFVKIPAFQTTASFSIGTINNSEVSADRTVVIFARAVDSFTKTPLESGKAELAVRITEDDGAVLTVAAQTPTIREDGTGTVRVRRNTGTTGNLTVSLLSSDLTELTLPATVIIPDGASFVDVTVTGVADGGIDGAQNVTVSASSIGYGGGSAVVTVTDSDLADLAVTSITAPTAGETGQSVNVSYTVTNQGVASAVGAWTDRVYISDRPIIDDRATQVRQFIRNTPLGVAGSYSQSFEIALPVGVGTAYILVQTDYVDGIAELREGNNTAASNPINVAPAYTATVRANQDVYGSGQPVHLSGLATRIGGGPAAFEFVKVNVLVNGSKRTLSALTAADGTFQTTFQPLTTEAGNYDVAATHPGVADYVVQDSFAIAGMRIGSDTVQLTPDFIVTRSGTLSNRSSVPITGIHSTVLNVPEGLQVTVNVPSSLPGDGSVTLLYSLLATKPDVGRGTITIRLTSDQGATVDLPVTVDVVPLTASLVTTPGALDDGMIRGERKTLSFTLRNSGSAASGAVSIALPDFPWLRLVSPSNIPSLDPGATATISLELNPAADVPLQLYTGQIAINAANGATRALGFRFRAISVAQGDVQVSVVDEYTYYVEGNPKVAGATVRLYDPFDGSLVASGTTSAAGSVVLPGVHEGSYQLEVFAPEHGTYRSRLDVKPGVTNTQEVFVQRQLVTYSWTVVPVDIQDTYKVVLQPTFQTNVPVPVVTVEEAMVMPLVVEDEWTQFNITLTNHGLIAAKGVKIQLPISAYYEFRTLVDDVGDIPAKTTIQVPIGIRGKVGVTAAESGIAAAEQAIRGGGLLGANQAVNVNCLEVSSGIPCLPSLDIKAVYFYECGPDNRFNAVPVSVEPVCVAKDIYECLKQAWGTAAESLPSLGGNLANAPCALIDLILQCADTGLSDCKKAMIKAACRGITGFFTGGPAGAAAGVGSSIKDLLECFCDLFDFDFDIGDVELRGGGFGTGGWGGGYTNPYGGGSGGSFTTSGCSPASGSSSTGSSPVLLAPNADGSGVCATVTLRIEQQAVLTRTGFAGTFTLKNGTAADTLSGIRVDLDIRDSSGNSANQKFGFRDPDVSGMGNVGGTGVLAAGQTGTARYLFVPTRDAAPTAAQTYHIGGTLRYLDNGVEVSVPLIPATITVHPDALLSLDYFLQRDVFSDDPFTEAVEPSEPFSLGVLVNNSGAGKARNFHIISGQPEIIENQKGLLIDFDIIGTQVGADTVSPSLTANFGDILAGTTRSARWLMTSTLQGHFIDYKATFEHVDDFGNSRTSLIDVVNFHELERALRTGLPGKGLVDDGQYDFLANDIPDEGRLPDTLYFSSGGKAVVHSYSDATTDGPVTPSDLSVHVSAPSASSTGWTYLVFGDPGTGFVLKDVIRSDGSHLKVGDHAWRTDRTFGKDGIATHIDQVHILDLESTGSYTLVYGKSDELAPSVTQLGPITPSTRSTPVSSVDVMLSEKLAAGSFDISDVTLTRNGTPITLSGVASVVKIDDTHYSVTGLSGVTGAAGSYVLSVNGAGIQDLSGNSGSGITSQGWNTVADAPVISSLGDGLSALANTAVGQVLVSFSKPIDAVTFDVSDVTLTRNGTPVALSSPATITQLTATDFRIDALSGFTADEGNYVLSVNAAGITDTAANAGVGSQQASWTADTTAPTITFLETLAANPRNTAVLNLTVEFSEPIDLATMAADDVSLTLNGGTDLFNSGLTVTQLSATRFRLGGFTSLTGVQGDYVFTVNGAGISDKAGNAASNSASTTWRLDTAAPGAPTNLAVTPDNGSSSSDGRTNVSTVTLTGTLPEAGSSARVVDLTTNTNFGAGTTTGNAFTKELTFAAAGTHRLRVFAVDAAGNVSGDSFFDVFVDLAKPTIQSVSGFGASTITVPINELTVTFDKAISAATFTVSDVTLTRDGAPVNMSGASIVQVSPTAFKISGLTAATTPLGAYVLTVNLPEIFDEAGNSGTTPYAVAWERASAVATIGDTVFQDANFNGMRETDELPAVGVTVRLHSDTGTVLVTTTTDSSGHYTFGGLDADARYFVEFVAPSGYGFTHQNVTNDASDSDADVATGRTEVFDVAVGPNNQWDAGLVQLGTISGQVYNDANNNRQRDAAEQALGGFTVFVDLNRNNQHEAGEPTAVTAADGSYRFDNLRPGTYVVAMEVPAGWQQTSPDQAGVVVSIQSANLTPTANLAGTATPETPTDGFSAAEKLIGLDRLAADSRFAHLTGAGYTVVVIDTGIDLNNSFFGPDANADGIADRISFQYDFGANDNSAQDLTGHGTHIASIIGSGDATYRGVAPGVNFVVFKIFDDGGNAIFAQAEKALQWVTNNTSLYNILAVNMSFGDGRNWDWPDATDCGCGNTVKRETYGLGDELATLRSMNVITSAAAGNNFYEVSGVQGMNYPAADPATISVGAVWDSNRGGSWSFNGTSAIDFSTDADAIAAFSQRQSGYLDVFAPGAIITGAKIGGGVTTMQGTSQSTAFVTGAAVLAEQLAIEHLGRRLTLAEFRTLLQTTGVTVFDGDNENDNVINTGQAYSRLDVYAMANAIMAMSPATPADPGGPGDPADPNSSGQGYAYQIAVAPGGSFTQANFGLRTAITPELELGNDPLQDKVVAGYRFQRDVGFTDGDAVDDWTVTINYGDGSAPVTTSTTQRGFSFDHLYANKGLYTITVTVSDDRGLSATDTLAFRVIPAVTDVRISGYDGTRFVDVHTIAIDFASSFAPGDTLPVPTISQEGGGAVPSFTYAIDPSNPSTILVSFGNNVLPSGTYDLTLLGAGFGPAFASAHGSSVNFTFGAGQNSPPVVNAGVDATTNEGDEWVQAGSFSDPDAADSWTGEVDYGGGAGYEPLTLTGNAFTLRHRFADDGSFNVHVKIRDSRGAERVDDVLVTVQNVAPTMDLGNDLTVGPDGRFAGAHSFADPGADTWAATVDYGDGTGVQPLTLDNKSFTLDHVYSAPGDYTVTVSVNDGDGGVASDTMRVKVVAAAQAAFQVNHGAVQRSSVNSLTITLSRAVAAQPGAFVVTRHSASGPVLVGSIVTPIDPDGDGYADTFELTFTGGSYDSRARSLVDGQYDVTEVGTLLHDASGYAAANSSYTFQRYYGDLNGNGAVDAVDVLAARLALGTKFGQSNYRAELDENGNRRIDASEYAKVRSRLRRVSIQSVTRTSQSSRGAYV